MSNEKMSTKDKLIRIADVATIAIGFLGFMTGMAGLFAAASLDAAISEVVKNRKKKKKWS